MKRRRPLRPDERVLWERVARTVSPLRILRPDPSPPQPPEAPQPAVDHQRKPRRDGSAPATSFASQNGAAEPSPNQPPRPVQPARPQAELDRKLRRKISRGSQRVEARLDLHGMTQQEAHGALIRFITGSHLASRQVVLVITGKGRGGEGAGILRRAVPHWLAGRELSPIVASYGPAHQSHGGAGALYVRLRSPKRAGKGRPRP